MPEPANASPDPASTPSPGGTSREDVPAPGVARRRLLRRAGTVVAAAGAGAAAGALLSAHAGRQEGATRKQQPTFLLVHGANSNAYAFAPLIAALALEGHRALAVDLPGHGARANFPLSYQAPQDLAAFATAPSPVLSKATLEDNARHVVGVVRRIARQGPVILVGHSMGGATITRVGNQVPDAIARMVYLSAFCCVRIRTILDCFLVPEGRTTLLPTIPSVGSPERTGVLRNNWRSADAGFLAKAKAAFAADYDDAAFRNALNTFEPDESASLIRDDARGHPATWGRIPRSYVRFTVDRSIPPALQGRMIKEADAATPGNRFDVHSLRAPHLGPADPAPLAAILAGLA
ncbi:alpha/beta fold hydrolase [Streptomyces rectiverticillatus]|uniref:alpha/beta hydrolase n=1 Tax=Streptomyces rectiverticillatus TaxID=173860 RepID=UPI0015C35BE4|nr:alpha/beta hydrolase family protein [Streptomyces rectiverticillatus]QLE70455.1 alpha/beta fold hydrolase [Streptomyces rectiverticillatus]